MPAIADPAPRGNRGKAGCLRTSRVEPHAPRRRPMWRRSLGVPALAASTTAPGPQRAATCLQQALHPQSVVCAGVWSWVLLRWLGSTVNRGHRPQSNDGPVRQVNAGATCRPRLSVRLSSTASIEKLPTFWLGGNSLNVRKELADVLLGRDQQEGVVHAPLPVVPAVRGFLEGIGAEVEEPGEAQGHKRLLPDIEAVGALLGEDDLPLVVAQSHQRAVIVEVEEFVARVRRLCRRVRR